MLIDRGHERPERILYLARRPAGAEHELAGNRSSVLSLNIIREAELPGLGGIEERTRVLDVRCGNVDRDRAESIQREAMRVSQRFTALDRRDAGGFQKGAHLLRMELATRHEHALRLRIHVALTLRQTSRHLVSPRPIVTPPGAP